ncbi:MAG: hypothetical protein Q8P69_01150 [bacterium]|nr:hypothetical protein [bacterium]
MAEIIDPKLVDSNQPESNSEAKKEIELTDSEAVVAMDAVRDISSNWSWENQRIASDLIKKMAGLDVKKSLELTKQEVTLMMEALDLVVSRLTEEHWRTALKLIKKLEN